jgi:hypothetical protein
MNNISRTTITKSLEQLVQYGTDCLNGISVPWLPSSLKQPYSVTLLATAALGFVGVGVYGASRIARWIRSPERLLKPGERRLTRGVLIPPTAADSAEMHENYQIGLKLLKYAKKAVLFSPNYLSRSEKYKSKCKNPQAARELRTAIAKVFLKVDEQLRKEVGDDCKLTFEEIEIFAKYAVKYNVANCHGMCCACVVYAKNKGINKRIEIFQIDNHIFLLIGRNPKMSLPSSWERWGRDAIVCDPWAQSCYSASEIETQLMDLSRVMYHPVTGEQYTIVKQFSSDVYRIGGWVPPGSQHYTDVSLFLPPTSSNSSSDSEETEDQSQLIDSDSED